MRILAAVAHSEGASRSFARLGSSLIGSTRLEGRLREIAILALAAHLGEPYEWKEHEPFAIKEGVGAAELRALHNRDFQSSALSELEQEVIQFALAVAGGNLTDDAWDRMAKHLGGERLVELVLVASWWGGMVPRVVSALDISADGDDDD